MNKFEKFCYKYNHVGISNLMLFVAVCNGLVFLVSAFVPDMGLIDLLAFNAKAVMAGQIWRLITFVFIPPATNILFLLLACYFYYWIGKTLENEWGKLKFNIFYLTGMLLTMVYCWLSGDTGTAIYLNFSLFLAFATLFPEQQIMFMLFIPVKVKYMGFVLAGWYGLTVLLGFGYFPLNMAPMAAFVNYLLYFHKEIYQMFRGKAAYSKRRTTFKQAVHQARKRPEYEGYVHRCVECGITDTQAPDMEFRYCSLCAHYECYCSQHIFTHEHKT